MPDAIFFALSVKMDHLPFWHIPTKGSGQGFGQGTSDIIEVCCEADEQAVRAWTKPLGVELFEHFDAEFMWAML